MCTPNHPEGDLEPKGASCSGVITITHRWLPLALPGFLELLTIDSGPPPFKDVDTSFGEPGGQLDLISLGSM